jgi:flagellar capping protein FliD
MTIQDWAALVLSILTIVGIMAGGIKFLVKHYLVELKPNSGSSMKDQISRLETRINEADAKRSDMNRKLDHMYDVLLEYIAKSK